MGCDGVGSFMGTPHNDFNPRTPCGVRPHHGGIGRRLVLDFNPRTPCGVRRARDFQEPGTPEFQSTHPVWGATPGISEQSGGVQISIHAPRVGCDMACCHNCPKLCTISIHAPRVGCDRRCCTASSWLSYFNPRTPCGVRPPALATMSGYYDFNPRTPCGVRRCPHHSAHPSAPISIHAPRVGCDAHVVFILAVMQEFQSTHPVWGATRVTQVSSPSWGGFQSTHPVWGATAALVLLGEDTRISIHAPRVGCDLRMASRVLSSIYFNPRTPCGVRPLARATSFPGSPISIHAPRVGCDALYSSLGVSILSNFNPRTPCGVRRWTH